MHSRGIRHQGCGHCNSIPNDEVLYGLIKNENRHQEECRRESTERTKVKVHVLVDLEARAHLFGGGGVSDIDPRPNGTEVHVTATGYYEYSCWGPPLLCYSSVWILGSKGSQILSGARKFRAQDLGFEYGAPTVDDTEEDTESYSKGHGNEAFELHRRGSALLAA